AATNVYWAWHFWERIAAVDSSMGFHPDLRRLLQTHGYVGAGTKSTPGGNLPQELETLVTTAAAPHGVGMQEVTGQRRAAVWTDLWTAATNVDYLLGGCRTQSEVLTRLASDDALELHLRRLASYAYELRTKDKVGAAARLAVRPPGSSTDLAPTWLVTEATAHSKVPASAEAQAAAAFQQEAAEAEEEKAGGVAVAEGASPLAVASRRRDRRASEKHATTLLAWKLAQQYALQDAARYERDCPGLAPTGGHGTEVAHDKGPQDAYTGDVQEVVERQARERCMRVLFLSADLLDDPRWDLANPATFSALMELCEGGRVDIVLGGPPCSTWSRARCNRRRPGPPPVRSRLCPLGLLGLRAWGAARNLLALCEACGQSGGAFLIEHPEDPGHEPYPSIWNTEEMLDFEGRRSAQQARLDQCMLGGRARKPTCLSGALQGMEALNELRCDGSHVHASAEGKLADGAFRASPLAQHPEAMCETLGGMVMQNLACFELSGLGGAGWRRPPEADGAATAWGTRSSTAPAVAVRNEDVLRGRGLVLDGPHLAFYLHVDDGAVMAGGKDGGSRATSTMHQLADALAEAGFVVTDRAEACDMRKVLGYAPQARPAQLCIPSAVFRLLERYSHQRVSTWATVRRELRAMAKVVPLMYADLGAPPAPVYFAADAVGANAEDDGGWGALVTDMSKEIAQDFIDTGGSLGYTVARLDGELTGLRRPEQMIRRTTPFSLLPDRAFKPDEDWTIVGQGRWRSADHITLGEGRCVVKISRLAAATPALHRTVPPILEDNQPVSGAVHKGRSPAHQLNRLLRLKTAAGLASRTKILIPWMETLKQPADEISRCLNRAELRGLRHVGAEEAGQHFC
ncbi:unnamed protein product, partial [Prorocentrum cordatum]